jgi:hypothetical protein
MLMILQMLQDDNIPIKEEHIMSNKLKDCQFFVCEITWYQVYIDIQLDNPLQAGVIS